MAIPKKSAPPKKVKAVKTANPLFPARPKTFRIGNDIQPRRDLTRYVKWPLAIRIQRQRKILMQRLKVPPSINQFSKTLDKNVATEMYKLLLNYKTESRHDKKQRLKKLAQAKLAKEQVKTTKPIVIKYGLKHVTSLIESKKAQIVCIASNVVPLELVVWLPALCRKMGVPYCIINCKTRLGALVHKKSASCLALTAVRKEDNAKLESLKSTCMEQFNVGFERKWGGGIMGMKTQKKMEKREKAVAIELAKKAQY